jgi:hypothetical protein
MTGQSERMTTGEFSRRSQLSIKALRLYDRLGLLPPTAVDGRSGRCGGVAGQRFVIFHGLVSADSDGPVEVCVPVTHPPDDPAELPWRVEPAHHEAFIQVTRAHFQVPAILSIYDQLARWVSAASRKQIGSPREVYTPRRRTAVRRRRRAHLRCGHPLFFVTSIANAGCAQRHRGSVTRTRMPYQAHLRYE